MTTQSVSRVSVPSARTHADDHTAKREVKGDAHTPPTSRRTADDYSAPRAEGKKDPRLLGPPHKDERLLGPPQATQSSLDVRVASVKMTKLVAVITRALAAGDPGALGAALERCDRDLPKRSPLHDDLANLRQRLSAVRVVIEDPERARAISCEIAAEALQDILKEIRGSRRS